MKKIVLAVCCCATLLGGCDSPSEAEPAHYKEEIFAMDTYMTLSAYGEKSEMAVKAAGKEVQRLDELLSVSGEKGDVYQLNQRGQRQVEPDTLAVISKAAEVSKETEGLFDCTIAPVMKIWGFRDGNFRVPSAEELAEQLEKVDGSKIRIEGNTITLLDGVTIDLGAIAKGYTSQRIMEIYGETGVSSGIVSLGGNVQTLGTKPDGSLWRIALEDPRNPEGYFGVLEVADKAVITSGGYQRNFTENGKLYHHIIDPRTGYPAENGFLSVTIVSEDGTLADALSTVLFIMGPEKAETFWQEHKGLFDAVMMTDEGKILVTEGLRDIYTPQTKDPIAIWKG
ncbi:FAD:protein FMN transferase [Anaerotignum sp.]|uniref:FAD:protein FMN transferase n=1 Tax=Anaerotignum sp. TaxID=2039241 RepID=UPI002A916253|nr:FAD:protein FMN transferase [Anaerotignum sp.]MCI7657788.1 FAD:protein FMN transferase [Clostridia bacterium]MDY5415722.1 FAD:protein FMN transferase [Anaerotignum sp.]